MKTLLVEHMNILILSSKLYCICLNKYYSMFSAIIMCFATLPVKTLLNLQGLAECSEIWTGLESQEMLSEWMAGQMNHMDLFN